MDDLLKRIKARVKNITCKADLFEKIFDVTESSKLKILDSWIFDENDNYILYLKQVLRNFKFYQTFKPRPSQNSNTFFFSKSLKTYLKIYFN
jgi:hypothetical protein